jgi:hypothetical protein
MIAELLAILCFFPESKMQDISGTHEGNWRQKLAADLSYKKTNKSLKSSLNIK